MLSLNFSQQGCRALWHSICTNQRYLRSDQRRPSKILDDYANIYRPEVQSEMEHLAVQTSTNKELQINYEKEQQRKRQLSIRYHILRRKYVAHPSDIQVSPYVKNHMQFLRKNYPDRWTVEALAESFNQSVDNVRLILQQRTTRRMRVRPRPRSSLFGVEDDDEREKIVREHMMKRDLPKSSKPELESVENQEPVDCQVLAEESNLLPRRRPSDDYIKRDNDGFFSNVISSSDEDQQNERDISMKKKLLTSPSTLLDRINKLRLSPHATAHTYVDDQPSDIQQQRMSILQKMQASNDAIVDMNERKQKFLPKPPLKK